jgi:hypothetical protein
MPGGPGLPGVPGADQWYTPPTGPGRPRKRPRWLLPAGAAALLVVVVVALVLGLSSGSPKTTAAGTASTPSQTHGASATATPTPTVGGLLLAQFQAGDCLTGANMQLNKTTPWPKVTLAVPCGQDHTAEVIFANNYFWSKSGSYPGSNAIRNKAIAGCDSAFQSYVGIAYSKSMYTWTDIVPDASTWPGGDRALHCVAYYATTVQPAGVTLHSSIRGTAK